MTRTLRLCTFAAAACLLATGCTDTRRALGLEKVQPDEFAVVSRAPLTLPPDFTLRPPDSKGPRAPSAITPTEQARQTVFRAPVPVAETPDAAGTNAKHSNLSPGETALLTRAGATNADPKIRQIVNQENTQLLERDHSFIDQLVFWQPAPEPGTVVDAEKEAQRLRENAALGKPTTGSDSPSIERKRRALLEGIFN